MDKPDVARWVVDLTMEHVVFMIPGLGNSDAGHWQSIWQRDSANYRRVVQSDWDAPDMKMWVSNIAGQIESVDGPLFLVAHSIGCAAVAHWSASNPAGGSSISSQVLGALLVSPADVDDFERVPPEVRSFAPIHLGPFAFPSVVVASNNDPFVTEERARFFASCWGSEFVSAGPLGHITTTTGHGDWPVGRDILNSFVAKQIQMCK